MNTETEDTRIHATLVADIERLRMQRVAIGTLTGVDLNRLSPADLRALETKALAEAEVTLRARAEGAARDEAHRIATTQTREQVNAREAERVVNIRARQHAKALENDQRRHWVRPTSPTPEPPLAA